MSEEIKLLTALCEALGFKVEETVDRKERKENQVSAMRYNDPYKTLDRKLKADPAQVGMGMRLDIDDEGMYTSYLIEPEVTYKLVKVEK